ncbi:hypothetical protein MUN84_20490 [Hymenobacter sp. 5516J-16]|uniref:hypothetical protein n=1 Tax=Hymenobacter sp. 5516J-16 TaxID=2932253 RepID=UPI001FCF8350|nr:hypothetical protein [Hymenobacter sp. 5516J-16]UOQ76845.1 hypothetical protein MUN84_20490 [Hymenobacter sp. 5516J-16]
MDCDVEFEAEARRWAEQVLGLLAKPAPEVVVPVTANAQVKPVALQALVGGAEVELEEPVEYTSRNPFEAELLEKIQLNGRGSTKETYHLEFSLVGSGIAYEAGDALMVQPHNRPGLVQEVLDAARLDATAPVRLESSELDLTTVLTERLELSVVTRDVLERYAALARTILSCVKFWPTKPSCPPTSTAAMWPICFRSFRWSCRGSSWRRCCGPCRPGRTLLLLLCWLTPRRYT